MRPHPVTATATIESGHHARRPQSGCCPRTRATMVCPCSAGTNPRKVSLATPPPVRLATRGRETSEVASGSGVGARARGDQPARSHLERDVAPAGGVPSRRPCPVVALTLPALEMGDESALTLLQQRAVISFSPTPNWRPFLRLSCGIAAALPARAIAETSSRLDEEGGVGDSDTGSSATQAPTQNTGIGAGPRSKPGVQRPRRHPDPGADAPLAECRKRDQGRHRSHGSRGPTLIYLHGGAFRGGRKSREARPLIYRLASQGRVCISANYRLSPSAQFPDHLIDAKKVIARVRERDHEYGGDPAALSVAGSSAGAHLASTAALTPNDPGFQLGFADADTSVTAPFALYGYYGEPDTRERSRSSPQAYVQADAPPFRGGLGGALRHDEDAAHDLADHDDPEGEDTGRSVTQRWSHRSGSCAVRRAQCVRCPWRFLRRSWRQ